MASQVAYVLINQARGARFFALLRSTLGDAFPLTEARIVRVAMVSLVTFYRSVTQVRLCGQNLISFHGRIPIMSTVTDLVSRIVQDCRCLVSTDFPFPIFGKDAFRRQYIRVVVRDRVITVFRTIHLVAGGDRRFSFLVMFVNRNSVFLVASLSRALRNANVVVSRPLRAKVVNSKGVQPRNVEDSECGVRLFFNDLGYEARITVAMNCIAVVVRVSPRVLRVANEKRSFLSYNDSLLAYEW